MRLHFLSNSPKSNSGFSVVTKNLALGLKKLDYDVSMTGLQTSYISEYYEGIKIFPLLTDQSEDVQLVCNLLDTNPDVVIYIGEMYTNVSYLAKLPLTLNKKVIVYCPVEGSRIPKRMVNDLNEIAGRGGRIIAQCRYGYEEMQRCGVQVDKFIYHGFNNNIFRPLDLNRMDKYCYYRTDAGKIATDPRVLYQQTCYDCKLDRKNTKECPFLKEEEINILRWTNIGGDGDGGSSGDERGQKKWIPSNVPISQLKQQFTGKFVFLFVGANHAIRKKFERLLEAYTMFIIESRQLKDKTCLHLHTLPATSTGLNLLELVQEFGIQENVSFSYGDVSEECMNMIYNLADCHVSATASEGFGLSHLESMACGVVNIAPDCTSLTELIGKGEIRGRGLLARIGSEYMIEDLSKRSLVDTEDLSAKMKEIYTKREDRERYSKNCLEFVKPYTWNGICSQWDQLLKGMETKILNII